VDVVRPANNIALTGDEAVSAPVPLGFSFPFYGHRFTSARLCTNGYLQFGTEGAFFVNAGLPTSGAPRNMIAPFWDDLHFGSGPNRAYAHFDGTRCVLTWDAVPRYNDVESVMTFQCILYPSGEIRFQYRHMTGNASNATLGIRTARAVGLLVAFDPGLRARQPRRAHRAAAPVAVAGAALGLPARGRAADGAAETRRVGPGFGRVLGPRADP
jgi:hypothetical protein